VTHACPSVVAALEAAAGAHPQRTAVVASDGRLTYAQLRRAVAALSADLVAAGTRGGTVAVLVERGGAQLVAALAAMASGAAFACIDRREPAPRRQAQLAASGATVVVTDGHDDVGARVAVPVDLRRLRRGPAGDATLTAVPVGPDDPAYVVFTSGSTGTPKAVQVPHRALAHYARAVSDVVVGAGRDRSTPVQWAHVTSLATDLGHTAVFPALMRGDTVHVVPWDVTMDPLATADYVHEHAVDVLKTTPSHLTVLLDVAGDRVLPRATLVIGGEGLTWRLADRVTAAGRCRLVNHYGPSETTVGVLTFPVDDPLPEHRACRYVPLGRPLAGTTTAVVDDDLVPVPDGDVGELLVRGPQVALGYLGDAAGDRQRFVRDADGHRAYRTGDLARRLSDGTVEFLGRRDRQVKVHGHRVELGEVEHLLARHPGVRSAVARLEPESGRLEAFVVPTGAGATDDDLRRHVAALASPQYIPWRVRFVDVLPLTLSGKLDEVALRALGGARR